MPPSQTPTPEHNPYDFIVNPEHTGKKMPLGGSLLMRLAIAGGGLVVLLVLLVVVKGLITTDHSNRPLLTGVAERQQSIIHIAAATAQQPAIHADTASYAATTELSVISAQNRLLGYMQKQNLSVDKKQLAQLISPSIDSQLKAAGAAGTYDETFRQILESQLSTYQKDLKLAYAKTSGLNGRKLLSEEYSNAELLRQQIGAVPAPALR